MPSRRTLFALFFVSGTAGLIYQVLWLRRLSLVFGVTVYAASTVLAAFMAGLAIGSLLAGGVLRRGVAPLRAFAVAEILVGATGLASPLLLDAASWIYVGLHHTAPDSFELLTVARLVCSFSILALPTALMGMTLPLLSAAVTASPAPVGSSVSLLYAVNTAGAVLGTLAAGFVLIPAIGMQRAFLVAATLNVVVGIVALWLGRRKAATSRTDGAAPAGSAEDTRARLSPVLAAVVVVTGFASLGLEIVWFRLMLQFVAATTEAFTAMLAAVLAGIAIGGFFAARILIARVDVRFWLTMVLAAAGLATVASMSFLLWTVQNGWNTMSLWLAVGIAILPSSIFIGVGFPLAMGISAGRLDGSTARRVGDAIGRLYAFNVIGAIAGSLTVGFVLLPWLGSAEALVAMAALFVASGLLLAFSRPDWQTLVVMAVVLAAFVRVATTMPDPFQVAIDRRYNERVPELWRDEGAQTAVSVRAGTFRRVLYLDGLHQANDTPGMVALHRAIGHLPMVLHGSPSDALVVGLGGGATPGAVSQYPDARLLVVELSEGVVGAAPLFAHVNYDLLNRPNVTVRIDDGRNFLALTDRRFDVITADIIQPGHAGAGHVYSREYFSLVRRALKDDGVVLQWIGHRPSVEYRLIMRTFLDVFPESTLWYDGNFMVGTRRPLKLREATFERLRQDAGTRRALDEVGLTSFAALRSWYTGGASEMRAFVGTGPLLTDDRPLVEYHHWLPPPQDQPPLDLSMLKGDVNDLVVQPPPEP